MSRIENLPPDIRAWPGVEITERLTGGARAGAWAARRGTNRLVVKVSTRSRQSLNWELDLLRTLHQNGLSVPTAVPTADGRNQCRGVWVAPSTPRPVATEQPGVAGGGRDRRCRPQPHGQLAPAAPAPRVPATCCSPPQAPT